VDLLWNDADDAVATLVFGHGAGAAMDSPAMTDICGRLAERGIRTARFEFGYMAARRDGVRRPPPRAETLTGEYLAAVAAVGDTHPLLIGGKSLGGRVATMVADELRDGGRIRGVVSVGYPFHPPEKPQQLRTAHLIGLRAPTLICQGTRDPFGGPDEVAGYGLSPAIEVRWFDDGDHDLRPRKSVSGFTHREHLDAAADAIRDFVERVR
jgi:predicted alpha/beta-hydrolase family hydrolase